MDELLPTTLSGFRNYHRGADILVCGCGTSLRNLRQPERYVTIGVNDVGRQFQPTYLVVLNGPSQFAPGRFEYVQTSRAKALFTQIDLGVGHPNLVRFRLGERGGVDLSADDRLPYTRNSPYVAICLAAFMGAKRIGLIGVDYNDDHFFAPTGPHALSKELGAINGEYERLRDACRSRGVEIYNLSAESRVDAFPEIRIDEFTPSAPRRVFFVHYKFLACGDVFTEGLERAASDIGLAHAHAYWDAPDLDQQIDEFRPDLIFVVHGRKFVQRWGSTFVNHRTAVWLLDEPYEVDDTVQTSAGFDTVFVNDRTTLTRHRNAHYLPVAYDPHRYHATDHDRPLDVGFVGGGNATRERYLVSLAEAGVLSYVVGGPWHAQQLEELNRAANLPHTAVADLYRQTKLVVNVFRDVHHFNRDAVEAMSMNPRVYEALACGALVVSEHRPEIADVFPSLPTFDRPQQALDLVQQLLADDGARSLALDECRAELDRHTYQKRLESVLEICLGPPARVDAPSLPSITRASVPRTTTTDRIPRRNLLFHVWPASGSAWRWNLDQLLKRIELFNGKRVIGIVHDERSESPDAVKALLAGHGCEFVVRDNAPLGEVVTFPELLDRVASTSQDEVTFYGHAKGVKYGPTLPDPVRAWTEAMYRTCLDNWVAVKRQLSDFPMTGSLKVHGRFRNHGNVGDWHYTGTFFWMRHREVFTRDYRSVPAFYGGVEAWPGVLFRADETGCLLLDNLKGPPYLPSFWHANGYDALRTWEERRGLIQAPPDLANPLPIDGHDWPRTEQRPEELEFLIDALLESRVERMLSIGALHCGVEWHVARAFRQAGRDIEITAVDLETRPEAITVAEDARKKFGQTVTLVESHSGSPELRSRLAPKYDAVFIDASHGYADVVTDWNLAKDLSPRLIGLHDIVDSDWHAQEGCCVSRLWPELCRTYETEELATADWGGIGLVRLPSS